MLNIRDSGCHNILLREDGSNKLIAGIDLEEQRGSDKGATKLSYLFRKNPSKKERRLYTPHLDKIVVLP